MIIVSKLNLQVAILNERKVSDVICLSHKNIYQGIRGMKARRFIQAKGEKNCVG